MRIRRPALALSLCLGALPGAALAQTRSVEDTVEIPEAARRLINPVLPSVEALRAGQTLWQMHCYTCHGAQGRGDGPNARLHEQRKGRAPRNLTDPKVQENLSDGELYWRISRGFIDEGNIIMPAFQQDVPGATERWQLVTYVRELGRRARAEAGAAPPEPKHR